VSVGCAGKKSMSDAELNISKAHSAPADAHGDDISEGGDPLRRDVRMLGFELGLALRRHGRPGLFDTVERIRQLAKAHRRGDAAAEPALRQLIAALDADTLREVIRALGVFFDLANLAEDRHRARVLRERERQLHPAPRPESIGAAVDALHRMGLSAGEWRDLLSRIDIELVFTAHPTEAKRRTVRNTLRRLRRDVIRLEQPDLLPRERARLLGQVRTTLDCLWETDPLRPTRPTVLEEVRRALFVLEPLWDVIPWLYRSLRVGLEQHFPDALALDDADRAGAAPENLPGAFLRFGSWIGGDRDGNPFVTTQVTRTTLATLRQAALSKHLDTCRRLSSILSISDRYHGISDELAGSLQRAAAAWPLVAERIAALNPHERYRHHLAVIEHRLQQTMDADPFAAHRPAAAYADAAALAADVRVMARSLGAHGHTELAAGEIQDWRDRIAVFGFHVARLDIREDSRRLHDVVAQLAAALGLADDYAGLDESAKLALLAQPLDAAAARARLDRAQLSEPARETFALFELLHAAAAAFGTDSLGVMIISMTHQPSDVLTVLWLCNLAAAVDEHGRPALALPIVPLFETIRDLEHADVTLEALLACQAYRAHLTRGGGRQMCMIGYSDSTKDGGYLAANHHLYAGQRRLVEAARKHGVPVSFFHGRGGALGRGGGPAARSILCLPPDSVGGKIRITEQGEVLAERYDDPEIAFRHLEQVSWATLLVTAAPPPEVPSVWEQVLEQAAAASYRAYRAFVDDPDFLAYFEQATPIDSIETLPIASRPSRRRGRRTLADLRAIPYTFAWTQSRHMLTAWYGLGSGLSAWTCAEPSHSDMLRQMYQGWPVFRAILDNAELALAKSDLAIARLYAARVDDGRGLKLWEKLRVEYEKSRTAVLSITGKADLLDTVPWLKRSIAVRNPYVDALNLIQLELMSRRRGVSDDDAAGRDALEELLRLSVQGIAAGLRTTG
jgi:phosphoenolpyruvate carboxylase